MEKSPEQVASEQNLEMLADEPVIDETQEAVAPVAQVSAEQSLAGLLQIGHIALLAGGMKHTAAVWNEGACNAFAAAAVPVLRKYPWGGRVLAFLESGSGVEEMALFMVAMPLTMATVNAVRQDLHKPEPVAPAPEPEKPQYHEEAAAAPAPAPDECAADVDQIGYRGDRFGGNQ